MHRILAATAFITLCCAACATMESVPADPRLLDAQKELGEGRRLAAAGQYMEAVPFVEHALQLRTLVRGETHPEVADCLNLLGGIHLLQGDHARAESLYERALAIREATLGRKHPDVAASLNNLANLFHSQGDYVRAKSLYERALAIRDTARDWKHPDVALTLNNLANLHVEQGNYGQAELMYGRALEIREELLGAYHPDVAASLSGLANLSYLRGDYAKASLLHERALEIREATLGKNHPEISASLNDLARVRLAQQQLAEALKLFERAFSLSEEHLRQEVFGFSEARLASALRILRADEDLLYTLVRAYPDEARVRNLALSASLLRKGRSIEEIADTSRIIYRDMGQAHRETFERLRALRSQLSHLSFAGPGQMPPADYQRQLKELADQGDALEANLARGSAPLRALRSLPPPAKLIAQVAAALPRDGALVEFVAYNDLLLGASRSRSPRELSYLALLLFPDGRTRAIDLGPAEPIDSAALRLHDVLARRSVAYQPAAQELHALTFRPLVPLLDKVGHLFLSPDAQLALVPFAALHDGRDFLIDSFDITYLTSGKELLPRLQDIPPATSVVVLADPDFSSTPATPAVETAPTERSVFLERFFSSWRSNVADQPWPPLPGTRKEAEAIQRLFPQTQLLLGAAATKGALLTLPTPGLLHIATHGFFLEDGAAPEDSRAAKTFGAVGASGPLYLPADPLLRSGLVLAGVHVPEARPGSRRGEDSLVTALELAGLDLWGTQLVVLSACDTGRGDIKLGQGVYGLRRSLVVAGAETLVTSLWMVNDETTRELMESYYGNLLAGQGRTSALREAMRALRQKQPHPHFWAPFIAIGQDSPLRGLAPHTDARSVP